MQLRYERVENIIFNATGMEENIELVVEDNFGGSESSMNIQNSPIPVSISFPNPFTNELYFNLELLKAGNVKIELSDMNGKVLQVQNEYLNKGFNSVRIKDVTNLPIGYLTYRVITSEGVRSGSLVKQQE